MVSEGVYYLGRVDWQGMVWCGVWGSERGGERIGKKSKYRERGKEQNYWKGGTQHQEGESKKEETK